MKMRSFWLGTKYLMISMLLNQGTVLDTLAHEGETHTDLSGSPIPNPPSCLILSAARLFDGITFPQENMAVLIEGNKVSRVDSPEKLSVDAGRKLTSRTD